MKTINEREIQNRLWHSLYKTCDLVVPNFFVGAWEMDMCALTKAGVLVEYEIKRTLADFRNDFTKTSEIREGGKWVQVLKHEHMVGSKGAARFYFVVPNSLVPDALELLPKHAGLMCFDPTQSRGSFVTERKAPLLHHNPVDVALKTRMCKAMYWRYWNLRRDFENALKRRECQPSSHT